MLELGEQQESGVRGQQVGDRFRRGVCTVRRAERVVDVEIAAVGELTGEARVVLRLAGIEARVLEHRDPVVWEELAEPLPHRFDRVRLRPAQMGADPNLARVLLQQQLQGRQRGPDAGVVRDLPVLERHVQIRPDEHGLPCDLGLLDGARQLQPTRSTWRRCS